MDIRQLEALVGIADHGSFSQAAAALDTVQSNISHRVSRLESELASELIDRATGALTESGELVVARGRRILSEVAAIATDVTALHKEVHGTVTIGMVGTAGRWIVPLLLEAQRANYPYIQLHIKEGTNSALEPQLVHGELDLAVVAWPVGAAELTSDDLYFEDLVVMVSKDHPLATGAPSLSLNELSAFDVLLPMTGTPIRQEIDEACARSGVTLRPLIEVDGIRTIASLAFDGHGPAILPATMLSAHLRDLFVGIPLRDVARRRVVLASRRYGFPSAAVRTVRELLHGIVHEQPLPASIYRS